MGLKKEAIKSNMIILTFAKLDMNEIHKIGGENLMMLDIFDVGNSLALGW